jgi:peptide/nickel transport system ATP-binding protein
LAAPKAALLEVKNLVVEFPGSSSFFRQVTPPFRAIDGISFTVSRGEVLGLVGESGCGKSTLAKTILQLIRPASGEVLLNGRNLHASSSGQQRGLRRELQIVFQDPFGSLNPRLTIGEAIAEPMQVHGIGNSRQNRHERVVQLLESVQLQADQFHRYPHQFSGGQRQRICIARALAADPGFLVFDESVSALDVRIQAQVLNLLSELRTSLGFSAIFISHDLGVVRYVCERMLVMQAGKIVESGDSDTLFSHPQHPCTQELIRAIPGRQLLHSAPGNL